MHRAACDWAECVCPELSFVWTDPALKLVYYEIPRCGSSSLKKVLQPEFSAIGVDDEPPADFASFAVIRNSWDRALSAWLLFVTYNIGERGSQRRMQCRELFGELPTFDNFIDRMMNIGSRNHHWAPICDFLPEGEVDYLIPFSNLEEEWTAFCQTYSTLPPLTHIKVGLSKNKHYSLYYTDKMRDLIGEYFQDDVERFEFTFEDHR